MDKNMAPGEYRPEWKTAYRLEQKKLRRALGPLAADVQHVGATAVPGLCACPELDILLIVRAGERERAEKCLLEEMGYEKESPMWEAGSADSGGNGAEAGEDPAAGAGLSRRFAFRHGGTTPVRLCLLEQGDKTVSRRILAVRDYLTAHPEVGKVYSDLKTDLALRYADDPDGYAAGKSAFLDNIEPDALAWEKETSGLSSKMSLGILLGGVLGAVLGHLAGVGNPTVTTVMGILLGVMLGAAAGMRKKDGNAG